MSTSIRTPCDVRQVIDAAGGATRLAEQLGISRVVLYKWNQVPADRCMRIEEITGISPKVLRPDVFTLQPLQRDLITQREKKKARKNAKRRAG